MAGHTYLTDSSVVNQELTRKLVTTLLRHGGKRLWVPAGKIRSGMGSQMKIL